MEAKERNYTSLASVDHKQQYVNIIAVINGITPNIRRAKLVGVELDISDSTMHNPGFVVTLNLDIEMLNQFLNVAKKGLLIELLDIKVIKNEGVVFGMVRDNEEMKLYDDKGNNVKWYSDEKTSKITNQTISSIKNLLIWKKFNFMEKSEERLKKGFDKDTRKSRLNNLNAEKSPSNSKKSLHNLKKTSIDSNTNKVHEDSPKRTKSEPMGKNSVFKEDRESKQKDIPSSLNKTVTSKSEDKKAVGRGKSGKMPLDESKKPRSSVQNIDKKNILRTSSRSPSPKKSESTSVSKESKDNKENSLIVKSTPTSKKSKDITFSGCSKLSLTNKSLDNSNSGSELNKKKNIDRRKKKNNSLPNTNKEDLENDQCEKEKNTDLQRRKKKETVQQRKKDSYLRKRDSDTTLVTKPVEKISPVVDKSKIDTYDKPKIKKIKSSLSPININGDINNDKSSNLRNKSNKSDISLDLNVGRETRQHKFDSLDGNTPINKNMSLKKNTKRNNSPIKEMFIEGNFTPKRGKIQNLNHDLEMKKVNKSQLSSDSTVSSNSSSVENSPVEQAVEISLDKHKNLKNTPIPNENKSPKTSNNVSLSEKNASSSKKKYENETDQGQNEINTTPKKFGIRALQNKKEESECSKEILVVEPNDGKILISKHDSETIKTSKTKKGDISNVEKSPQNNMQLGSTVLNDSIKKNTRGSLNKTGEITTHCNNKSVKKTTLFSYLRLITRKIHLREVDSVGDTSLCNLEEVYVPDNFDVTCKVISEFKLFEDNIQIVRVQDGTLMKNNGTLIVPESSSWNGVIQLIMKNPTVQRNSPFIDIIIFDFTRNDVLIEAGKYYRLSNIMAVKLNLIYDPRGVPKPNDELFYCAKGQYIYAKRQRASPEIDTRLNSEEYRKVWQQIFGDNIAQGNCSIKDLSQSSPSSRTQKSVDEKHISSLDNKLTNKDDPKEVQSPNSKKRKLNDSQIDNRDGVHAVRVNSPDPKMENESSKKRDLDRKSRVKNNFEIKNIDFQTKTNTTASSDETMLDETPALLKELSEIMHEESILGLPLTETEDIHLKNSGSEVTFSQFCEGAKLKANNFRTSTQDDNLSQSFVSLNEKEEVHSEDDGKMEPLVYCPSGSSLSSAVDCSPDKYKEISKTSENIQECSQSVLKSDKAGTISEIKSKGTQPVPYEEQNANKEIRDNNSNISNSSSVKVISSNSSELEYEIVQRDNYSGNNDLPSVGTSVKRKFVSDESKSLETSLKRPSHSLPLSPQKFFPSKSNDNLEMDTSENSLLNIHHEVENNAFVENDNEEREDNHIEIVVSDNSSNDSFFSVENYVPFQFNKPSDTLQRNQPSVHNVKVTETVSSEVDPRSIPERCFFKATKKPPPLTEDELNEIYNDENSDEKFFSYSHRRDLPFLTISTIQKLINSNSLIATVSVSAITPAITDSWQENCIKSRCPNCNQLYSIYNATNNRYNENANSTSAILVGSHIVCPESQCCNQVLESPEFHFSIEVKLKDGTPVTGHLTAKHAENIFGCTAQEAMQDEKKLNHIIEILQNLTRKISTMEPIKVNFTRENILMPKSGPLYIQNIFM